jgi:hypothetical protein
VIAIVPSYAQAEAIVSELKRAGFANSDISALFPDKQATRDFALEKHTKAPEGAAGGALAGGALGGAIGLLAGIGAITIPGLGPFIAAGPLMAAMSGAAAGAAVGGVTGALVGLGFPEIEAKAYEGKVRDGNILLAAHADDSDEKARAKEIFERGGATEIAVAGEKRVPAGKRPGARA